MIRSSFDCKSAHTAGCRTRRKGFTLLELMIVLLIMTIVLALAVPSYQQYLRRSHRVAAMDELMAAANCQQRIYAARFHFDTRSCLPAPQESHYSYRYEPVDTASTIVFKVIAIPEGSQILDECNELILDQSGWRGISGPEELQRKCWEGR